MESEKYKEIALEEYRVLWKQISYCIAAIHGLQREELDQRDVVFHTRIHDDLKNIRVLLKSFMARVEGVSTVEIGAIIDSEHAVNRFLDWLNPGSYYTYILTPTVITLNMKIVWKLRKYYIHIEKNSSQYDHLHDIQKVEELVTDCKTLLVLLNKVMSALNFITSTGNSIKKTVTCSSCGSIQPEPRQKDNEVEEEEEIVGDIKRRIEKIHSEGVELSELIAKLPPDTAVTPLIVEVGRHHKKDRITEDKYVRSLPEPQGKEDKGH